MNSLRTLDTAKIDAGITVALTAYTGLRFVQFKVHKYVPLDSKLAPYVRGIGYGLIALAGYQLYRSILIWQRGGRE